MNNFLVTHISENGPISVAQFLEIVLYDKDYGYYTKSSNNIIGQSGDFITSPEISQLFGETIATRLLTHWVEEKCPESITIIECGPGKGTLMLDILNIFTFFKNKIKNVNVYLIETSPLLKEMQKKSLSRLANILHFDDITHIQIPHNTTFIIANEYFDALPISQTAKNKNTNIEELRTISYDDITQDFYFIQDDSEFDIIETCPKMLADAKIMAHIIQKTKGLGLFIDYGQYSKDVNSIKMNDTLQAVYHHQKIQLFKHLGNADISHLVNFNELENALIPCNCTLQTQRDFLIQWGILKLLEKLSHKDFSNKLMHTQAVNRLINPAFMGEHFKVLTVT